MKQHLIIEGMTCGKCVASVTRMLESVPGIVSANVELPGSATIKSDIPVALNALKAVLGEKYSVREGTVPAMKAFLARLQAFRPLIAMLFFVMLWATVMAFMSVHHWQHAWMQYFMGGFFLLFGGLKVVNLKGFATMYRGYDLLAARVPAWGYAYPFVELALGGLFTFALWLEFANIATIVLMLFGTIGIIRALQRGNNLTCACLGGFFALPLTWVTVAENLLMVAMAALMLFGY